MVKSVVKRSGETEPFTKEKIVVSCLKAGAPIDLSRRIASDIEADPAESLESLVIRMRVLEELAKEKPDYKDHWEKYDRDVKRRT
ncbi:MAG: ATPase [candidate division Zixibacteria bacterium]|nr:ATPase [candidate division Zixibacteria bacterium]